MPVEIIIQSIYSFELASVAAEKYGVIDFKTEIVRISIVICYRLIDQL